MVLREDGDMVPVGSALGSPERRANRHAHESSRARETSHEMPRHDPTGGTAVLEVVREPGVALGYCNY